MALSVEILDEESQLDSVVDQWDALAVESGNPYCAPAWILPAIQLTLHTGERRERSRRRRRQD